MPAFNCTDIKPGETLFYYGEGYRCPMVLTDVGPLRADHLGRPFRTASMVRADDAGHALHLTLHAGNALAFARLNPLPA